MVDNVDYTPGSGATIAADEITGILHQRVKISIGPDGTVEDLDYGQENSAGSLPVVLASDQSDVNISLDGEVVDVNIIANSTGGATIHRSLDLDEGTLEVVKASAGTLHGFWVTNVSDDTRWIKFYNATSGTIGTGTPVITFGIPGNTSQDISGNLMGGAAGIEFTTGITVGASTGVADNDTGAPAANDVVINIFFE